MKEPLKQPSEEIQRAISRFKSESAPNINQNECSPLMAKSSNNNSLSSNSSDIQKRQCDGAQQKALGHLPETKQKL